ncbi:MAG TPA: DNA polymerase III subunit epsilon [Gammaproteobacteria bacterium]|jgi:DNA polymerase-3 subunit epsilon|nr:DNA polymerase III subunit epsilon [Gammaproteobacteria bacterium]
MRQVVLDTETTGLDPSQGHRVIEIGCVEIINRKLTNRHFHCYLNPDRDIDAGAIEVHGITPAFLADKPRFYQIESEFLAFVDGAELVIHNAPFDIGFLNAELARSDSTNTSMDSFCTVLDSLVLARQRHPGQRNNLDALCKRYGIDNTQRELHGALLDAEILADLYLVMTSGQRNLLLKDEESPEQRSESRATRTAKKRPKLDVIKASEEELAAHFDRLTEIDSSSGDGALWLTLDRTSR